MPAYEAGSTAALRELSLEKTALVPFLAPIAGGLIRAAPMLARAGGAITGMLGRMGAGNAAAGGMRGMFANMGQKIMQNKGSVAAGAAMGALMNNNPDDPNRGKKMLGGAVMNGLTAPFGPVGMGISMAGNMLMNR